LTTSVQKNNTLRSNTDHITVIQLMLQRMLHV